MQHCGQCGTANPTTARFCSSCGAPLAVVADQGATAGTSQPSNWATRAALGRKERQKATPRQTAMGCGCLIVLVVIIAIIVAAVFSGGSGSSTNSAVSPTDVPTVSGPPPTDAPTPTAYQWAAGATKDSYADVRDHPDLYQGDKVVWRCEINKFLGTDANDPTATDVSCGMENDTLSEIVIKAPVLVDTSAMHANDYVTLYGTVDQSFQGTNGFGATITEPQVDAVYLIDTSIPLTGANYPGAAPTLIPGGN